MSLVEIYRLANPEAAERDIPRALVEVDRAVATVPARTSSTPLLDTSEPSVGVVSAALLPTPNPPPPAVACSPDHFGDNWSADWFLQNFCTEGGFRACDANWLWYDSTWIKTRWFKSVRFEGDFNNRGRTAGEKSWVPGGCGLYTCLRTARVLWDYELFPRRVEGWAVTGDSSHRFRSTGWSSCWHAGFAIMYN
jgi:hypothetical protein